MYCNITDDVLNAVSIEVLLNLQDVSMSTQVYRVSYQSESSSLSMVEGVASHG